METGNFNPMEIEQDSRTRRVSWRTRLFVAGATLGLASGAAGLYEYHHHNNNVVMESIAGEIGGCLLAAISAPSESRRPTPGQLEQYRVE